jgi:hypothetical protein
MCVWASSIFFSKDGKNPSSQFCYIIMVTKKIKYPDIINPILLGSLGKKNIQALDSLGIFFFLNNLGSLKHIWAAQKL